VVHIVGYMRTYVIVIGLILYQSFMHFNQNKLIYSAVCCKQIRGLGMEQVVTLTSDVHC